jgi:hypothetical protein
MNFRLDCEFRPQYDRDGGVRKAECDCGEFCSFSVSVDPKRRKEALADLQRKFDEHWLQKRGPRTYS